MIEEGADMSETVLRVLRIPERNLANNVSVLEYLYTR